ncbi:MAG: hypothetical protein RLY83_78 [Actinomycetota bacterium]|jgi:hypothetical protein
MKKRDLEKAIRAMAIQAGLELLFVGGTKHDKFVLDGKNILIPRHREINELTANSILNQAQKYLDESENR